MPPLRILYATPECAPLVKTGGLGDVAGALPVALRRIGVDARLLLPGYRSVLAALPGARIAGRIEAIARLPAASLLEAELPQGVPAWIIDCPALYDRDGGPYQDARGHDWEDNPLRFGLLSYVAAWLGSPISPVSWRPQLVHANDWQTGLAPAYAALAFDRATPTLTTIHNMAFQGVFAPRWVADLALPASSFSVDGIEYHGRMSFLKAGLFFSNAITTVSPTYAREIQSEAMGAGLHGLLTTRRDSLIGILNGIDTTTWDPRNDALIPERYDAATLERKAANKKALQIRLGLEQLHDVPLLGAVARLTPQKGIDLLLDIVDAILALPAQIAIVAAGDDALEQRLRALTAARPARLASFVGFDETLAHLVEAGADAFVMPSRFEPCGLNQMYSQRYGTPPIVHATGGLVDSVVDCTPGSLADGTATGFKFFAPSPEALMGAIRRCISARADPAVWRALQQNGMARDFDWGAAAKQYAAVYEGTVFR
ncbi:MAG TPA: glycogen synthase GlgA [Casimicrobiaceae bacterium]